MDKQLTHELRLPPGEREDHRMLCIARVGEVVCGLPAGDPIHTVIRKVADRPQVRVRGIARPTKVG